MVHFGDFSVLESGRTTHRTSPNKPVAEVTMACSKTTLGGDTTESIALVRSGYSDPLVYRKHSDRAPPRKALRIHQCEPIRMVLHATGEHIGSRTASTKEEHRDDKDSVEEEEQLRIPGRGTKFLSSWWETSFLLC